VTTVRQEETVMIGNDATQAVDAQAATQALDDAATAAGHAPSIHNTQPWHWRLHGNELDLSVDRRRTLDVIDPDSRLAVLSCGAALHHALISLAADGWHATVTRVPHSAQSGHLATVRVDGRIPVEPAAVRQLRTIRLRYTDRRPGTGAPLDADKLRSIAVAAESQGSALQMLRPGQVFHLAAAADDAERTETGEAAWQAELRYWTGGVRPLGTGLPDAVIPHEITPGTVRSRDFGHRSHMLISEAHNHTAAFAILYGPADRTLDWLRAGEALSAVWLTATELAVSVLPLSATIEVASTRETMRRLLPDAGHPFLVLRFGVLNPAGATAPHTPRLPTDQIVERITD
jgi:nitroreductase